MHLGCEEACRQMVAGVARNAGVFAVAKGAALMVPPGWAGVITLGSVS